MGSCCKKVGEKYPVGNVFMFTRQAQLFLSVYVDDIKIAGRKVCFALIRLNLKKKMDLEEATPFIDQVHFGCTQRESATKESDVKIKMDLFTKITCTELQLPSHIHRHSQWFRFLVRTLQTCV